MTPEELGGKAVDFLFGVGVAISGLIVHMRRSQRSAVRRAREHPLFPEGPDEPSMEERVSELEASVRRIVREMEERDLRTEASRIEFLASVNATVRTAVQSAAQDLAASLDGVVSRVDAVVKRVNKLYDGDTA